MAKKNDKVRMPSSMAGITQYFDAATSNIVLTPKQVFLLIGLVIVVLAVMHGFA